VSAAPLKRGKVHRYLSARRDFHAYMSVVPLKRADYAGVD
jgi:hypothetical protein